MTDPTSDLEQALRRMLGAADVRGLARLTGGANMESWSLDAGGQGYVLRRAPSADLMKGRAFGHDVEAAVIRIARAHGVMAPEVVAEVSPTDAIGTGYVMRRIEGDTRPDRILAPPPPSLLGDLAREMARIHAIPLDALPAGVPTERAADVVASLRRRFVSYGGDRPIMALALAWLERNTPAEPPYVLLHGDFRIGNIMADENGLTGVLDWELATLGDLHHDLAYGCINSWRFGHIDRPAFGCGSLEALFAAYEAVSGTRVDRARFRFWLVYSTLWWGLTCLEMAEIWRSGRDRSAERAVIGRRASETEVDLLMLLDSDAPEEEQSAIAFPEPPAPRTSGEPSAAELIDALSGWLSTDAKPKLEGRDRFMANVMLNALGMLRREVEAGSAVFDKALSDDLLSGRASLATPGLLTRLRREALAKLSIDQPKYSALARARDLWGAT